MLVEQIKTCKENAIYQGLVKQIEGAAGDCKTLETILNSDQRLQQSQDRFLKLKQQLKKQVEKCKRKAMSICDARLTAWYKMASFGAFVRSNSHCAWNWNHQTRAQARKEALKLCRNHSSPGDKCKVIKEH